MTGEHLSADQREAALQRLEILDGVTAAFDRRVEVLETIASSASADEARTMVGELLRISEPAATAVLELQWRRFAELERRRATDERDRLRRGLT